MLCTSVVHDGKQEKPRAQEEQKKHAVAKRKDLTERRILREQKNNAAFEVEPEDIQQGPPTPPSERAPSEQDLQEDMDLSGFEALPATPNRTNLSGVDHGANFEEDVFQSPPLKVRRGLLGRTYSQHEPTVLHFEEECTPTTSTAESESIADHFFVNEPELPDLVTETEASPNFIISSSFLDKYKEVCDHKWKCAKREKWCGQKQPPEGMMTHFTFTCNKCREVKRITSHNKKEKDDLDKGTVLGSLSAGTGHQQLEEQLAHMGLHMMSQKTYSKHEYAIYGSLKSNVPDILKQNIEMEKMLAREDGDVDGDGLPFFTVIADGGWGVRSYNHSMRSNVGWAILIGARTGKIVAVGSRNKYCYKCARAHKLKQPPPDHTCYKNFDEPSTSMEQDIIVDAFCKSEKDHQCRFLTLIGDGDSSLLCRIRQKCPYGMRVVKIPCKNHAVRVYTSNLYGVAKNTALKVPDLRKVLRNNIPRLIKSANIAILNRTNDEVSPEPEKLKRLREELKQGPLHVFGDHQKCGSWCNRKELGQENFVVPFKQSTLWAEIERRLDYLIINSENLKSNVNTNLAECFMAVNNKIQGSKRINRANKGAFEGRTLAAVLKFNFKAEWSVYLWKQMQTTEPYEKLRVFARVRILRAQNNKAAREKRMLADPALRAHKTGGGGGKKSTTGTQAEAEYGEEAVQVDLPDDLMEEKKTSFLENLLTQVDTPEKRAEICTQTLGQFKNLKFREYREPRLTASVFGCVISLMAKTSPHNLVKKITHPPNLSRVKAIEHGNLNEASARDLYTEVTGKIVRENGLQTNSQFPYLGASPDGLIAEDGILEIKCLYKMDKENDENKKKREKKKTIFEFVAALQGLDSSGNVEIVNGKRKKKSIGFSSCCLEINENTRQLRLKPKHAYFYQVQGQLAITEKAYCDFFVRTEEDHFLQRIEFDEKLWKTVMLPKLHWFYMECLLPELINSRIDRGFKLREPKSFAEYKNQNK